METSTHPSVSRRGLVAWLAGGGALVLGSTVLTRTPDPIGLSHQGDGPPQVLVLISEMTVRGLEQTVAHGHATPSTDEPSGGQPGGQPGEHSAWSGVVRVAVLVTNAASIPALFSPGQLRLRVDDLGVTVAPFDAELSPGSLAARTTTATWIEFLAPPGAHRLALEFTGAGEDRPRPMDLPELH